MMEDMGGKVFLESRGLDLSNESTYTRLRYRQRRNKIG